MNDELPPPTSEDRLSVIARWKREPIRVSCLGVGCGPILVIGAIIGVVWWLTR